MDTSAPSSEARILALLKLIERDRDQRIHETQQHAELLARDIVRQARRDATRRIRAAAGQARSEARRRLDAAQAELSTRDRERDRELAASLLERAWLKLVAELERRWQDPRARASWASALAEQAAAALPRTAWIVEHPPELAADELSTLVRSIARQTGITAETRADPSLGSGLRFIADGTKLDGSVQGLLARRDSIQSRLLAELFRDGRMQEAP